MGFQSSSPDLRIGKMVWVFGSEEAHTIQGLAATHGIVIAVGETRGTYIVLDTTGVRTVWDMDLELMEDWDEEVEREDCSSEES